MKQQVMQSNIPNDTSNLLSLHCLYQMAVRNPTVSAASRRLFQHGQHFQDVSGELSMWINTFVQFFQ